MGSILYIAVIVIDVIVVLDILRGNKDNEKKLLWILAVIFLPILGPILYYVIGKKISRHFGRLMEVDFI